MNNGHTRESRHRIAVLEDEDVETFVAFCEYAYTGDYKVPRLPVPAPLLTPVPAPESSPREDTRTRAVECVTSPGLSWRGTYRSDSVSSAVPPPAPSPPPESETDAQTVKAEGEVASVVEEDVSAEAEAEVETEAEASPETEAVAEEAAEPEAQETPTDEAQPPQETDETIEPTEPVEEPSIADWAQYRVYEDALADTGAQTTTEPAERANSPTWEGSSACLGMSRRKRIALKKKMRKERMQTVPLEEEPPASLTPPSTPPRQASDVVQTQDEPAPDPEPVPIEAEDIEPEPVANEDDAPAELEEAEAEAEIEAPTKEPPASFLPSPAPSPSAILYDGPEWAQPDCPPQEENANSKGEDDTPGPKSSTSWDNSPTASQTIQEPSSPKPIIDMSFAKQQSDSSPRTPGLSLWDEFAALQYNDDTAVPSTPKPPTNSTSTSTELPYLTFHAKVYVFATRYLIPALAQLCLRKLHTDLVHLPLGGGNIEEGQTQSQTQDYTEADADADAQAHPPTRPGLPGASAIVLDVLRYAYTKTTRLEPINPTSATQLRENELRRLVVHYAACRVKELARWHGGGSGSATPAVRGVGVGVDGMKPDSLRALLDGTPELASDLVYRMM
ncbi:hypothetical protein PENSUB_13851 [Penicillium subrubescens]|uniref:BTB domain-containing protein n=2 Tax=Penicillium subrubescens TaxID=1316194 RepID=A0A1Q5SMQ5_9EURO|nr:hypothetical protein PENSUB_13851 [Penicillium subrubescens]